MSHTSRNQGTRNQFAKLNDDVVRRIREARARNVPVRTLAAELGISISTISEIARGRTWKHVDAPPIEKYERQPTSNSPRARRWRERNGKNGSPKSCRTYAPRDTRLRTFEEIGQILGISHGQAWDSHQKAIEKLRTVLAEYDDCAA